MVKYHIISDFILEIPNSRFIRMRTKDKKKEILIGKSKLISYFISLSGNSYIEITIDELDKILIEYNINITDLDASKIIIEKE